MFNLPNYENLLCWACGLNTGNNKSILGAPQLGYLTAAPELAKFNPGRSFTTEAEGCVHFREGNKLTGGVAMGDKIDWSEFLKIGTASTPGTAMGTRHLLKEPNRTVSFLLMPALLRGKDADSIATLFAGSDGSEAGGCDPGQDGRPRHAWPSGLAYKDVR